MNCKLYFTIFLLTVLIFGGHAQDPHFTQFYSNPIYQSPSFTGAVEGYRAALNHRDQWPKMPGKLTTTTFSLDYNLSGFNSGVGLFAMRDVAGSASYSNLNAGFTYAYNVQINRRVFFRPGAGFYYSQRSMNYQDLIFTPEIEVENGTKPILASELDDVTTFDAGLSALLLMHNFWIGITADHLMRPNISLTDRDSKWPIKYTLYGGYRFYKFERLIGTKRQSITVVGNYRHQGYTDQFDMGLYWNYDPIVLGVWYRDLPFIKDYSRRDAIALLIGYKHNDISIGYSYDFTISRLISSTGGAHEVSLIYKFKIEQKKKFKPIPCPDF